MKKNKGITLISLSIMLIILIIMASVTMYYGSSIITESKKQDLLTNMLLIQASLKGNLEQYNFEVQTIDSTDTTAIEELKNKLLVGKKVSENAEIQAIFNEILAKEDGYNYFENYLYEYYYLVTEDLISIGLNDIESNEEVGYYIVGYTIELDTEDEEYSSNVRIFHTKGYLGNFTLDSIDNA